MSRRSWGVSRTSRRRIAKLQMMKTERGSLCERDIRARVLDKADNSGRGIYVSISIDIDIYVYVYISFFHFFQNPFYDFGSAVLSAALCFFSAPSSTKPSRGFATSCVVQLVWGNKRKVVTKKTKSLNQLVKSNLTPIGIKTCFLFRWGVMVE